MANSFLVRILKFLMPYWTIIFGAYRGYSSCFPDCQHMLLRSYNRTFTPPNFFSWFVPTNSSVPRDPDASPSLCVLIVSV